MNGAAFGDINESFTTREPEAHSVILHVLIGRDGVFETVAHGARRARLPWIGPERAKRNERVALFFPGQGGFTGLGERHVDDEFVVEALRQFVACAPITFLARRFRPSVPTSLETAFPQNLV